MLIRGSMLLLAAGVVSAQETVSVQRVPQSVLNAAKASRKLPDPARFAPTLSAELPGGVDLDALVFEPATGLTASVSAGGQTMSVSAAAANLPLAPEATRRIYEVTIHPGQGYPEKFLVAPAPGGTPRPLLVGFHKFGVSHYDLLYHTEFFAQAINRDWHIVAPLGATGAHFSSLTSQINTEAVLNWMVNNFSIDKRRVYGVGFSMGGGAAMNYAARHTDPDKVMFAAIVNHTGTVDLLDAYIQDPGAQPIFDAVFGTVSPGVPDPFKMKRSSLITIDQQTGQVDTTTDLARNLNYLYSRTFFVSQDPKAYLRTQNTLLHGRLTQIQIKNLQHALYVYPGNTHEWATLNAKLSCDWLRTRTLQLPTSGSTMADYDGKYFHFLVTQDAPDAFTPFTWNLDMPGNALSVTATANLLRLSVDSPSAGLNSQLTFTAVLSTSDGLPDQLRLLDWDHLPSNVLRDGVATSNWTYDSTSGALTLSEYVGQGTHTWQVIP